MHALVNAFMRCLSFLLPPSWLCVSLCLWVGGVGDETLPRPNPSARFKSTKPLTYEEVAAVAALEAQGGSSPSLAPGTGCVSLAATGPAAPLRGPSLGRTWIVGLWRAVERVFGAPWVLLTHLGRPETGGAALRAPYAACICEVNGLKGAQGGATSSSSSSSSAAAAAAAACEAGIAAGASPPPGNMSGSVGIPSLSPAERASDASPLSFSKAAAMTAAVAVAQCVDEVITVDPLTQEMGTVTITVAIQAAEDEELEEVSPNHLDFLGGSCSEDELGRHDKSRFGPSSFPPAGRPTPPLPPVCCNSDANTWRRQCRVEL